MTDQANPNLNANDAAPASTAFGDRIKKLGELLAMLQGLDWKSVLALFNFFRSFATPKREAEAAGLKEAVERVLAWITMLQGLPWEDVLDLLRRLIEVRAPGTRNADALANPHIAAIRPRLNAAQWDAANEMADALAFGEVDLLDCVVAVSPGQPGDRS